MPGPRPGIERPPTPIARGEAAFRLPDFDLPGVVRPPLPGIPGDGFEGVTGPTPAPTMPKETPVLNLGGMIISGLDINAIEKGKFVMRMPLQEGDHGLPVDEPGKGHANPNLRVEKNSHMGVDVVFGKGTEGKSVMTGIKAYFSPSVRIINPASAFQPNGAWGYGGVTDWVKDSLADMVIDGFHVGTDGRIHVEGKLEKGVGPITTEDPLIDHIPPSHFPAINMVLESRLPDKYVAKGSAPAGGAGSGEGGAMESDSVSPPARSTTPAKPEAPKAKRDLGDVLRRFGAIAGKGNFALSLDSGRSDMQVNREGVKLWTDEGPKKVVMKGYATLQRSGSVEFEVEKHRSGLNTPALGLRAGVTGHVTRPDKGQEASVDLDLGGDVGNVQVRLNPSAEVTVPAHVDGDQSAFKVAAHVDVDKHRSIAATAKVHADAMMGIAEDPEHAVAKGAEVGFGEGDLKTGVDANVTYSSSSGVKVDGTTVKMTFEGSRPRVAYDGFYTSARGSFGTEVVLRDVKYKSGDGYPSLAGESTVILRPSAELLREFPDFAVFERKANFVLDVDGKSSIKMEGGADISGLLSSVVNLEGNPAAIVSMDTPAIGSLGSDEYRAGIEKLMVDPGKHLGDGDRPVQIRMGNEVEWLIDGKESRPKRLELIDNAKESLCMQTLIFKADKTGMETAEHLAAAAQRGVAVRVIVDSLGNMEKIEDLINDHPAYKAMVEGGVQLKLYNDGADTGLRSLLGILRDNPDLTVELTDLTDITNPAKAVRIFHKLSMIAQDRIENTVSRRVKNQLQEALGNILDAKDGEDAARVVGEIAEYTKDGVMEVDELIGTIRRLANLNHRWHEKYLIADGYQSVTGGLNIADEYLLGGEVDEVGKPIEVTALGVTRPAWRDTDVFVKGAAAYDNFQNFADNWEYVTRKDGRAERIKTAADPHAMEFGGIDVMSVQHRPHVDGDHNMVNFFAESLKAMEPGQKAIFANAYFIPTGSLTRYKEALIDAAARGVDVNILTNSGETSDMPQLNQAAIFPYRELLEGGVRIWERTGRRTMHQKCFSMGGEVSGAMSWNGDNRSGALNSEHMTVVFDPKKSLKMQRQLEEDMDSRHCKEVKLADVAKLPWREELEAAGLAWFSNLM